MASNLPNFSCPPRYLLLGVLFLVFRPSFDSFESSSEYSCSYSPKNYYGLEAHSRAPPSNIPGHISEYLSKRGKANPSLKLRGFCLRNQLASQLRSNSRWYALTSLGATLSRTPTQTAAGAREEGGEAEATLCHGGTGVDQTLRLRAGESPEVALEVLGAGD